MENLIEFLLSILRVFLPLGFCLHGVYLCEKSGVPQIAMEAYLLMGALIAATTASLTQSWVLGIAAAFFALQLLALIQVFCIVWYRLEAIVVGMAINLFVFGLAPFWTQIFFKSTGSTPALPIEGQASVGIFVTLFILTSLAIFFFIEKTNLGIWHKFAGENPGALRSAGINPGKVKAFSIIASAAFGGLGGAVLSLCLASQYSPMMSAGRGFIALAALILGRWNWYLGLCAALFFSLCEASQIRLQSIEGSPAWLIQLIPYLITLLVLVIYNNKGGVPAGIGKHD